MISAADENNNHRATPQNMTTITPKARHLTIQQVEKIIFTDTSTEFEYSEEDASKANFLWDMAVQHEWTKASNAEWEEYQKYPFLLCHTGEDMSGYQRNLALIEAIQLAEDTANNNTATQHNGNAQLSLLRPIHNVEDYYCVQTQLFATVAASISGEEFIVMPLGVSLKFVDETVSNIQIEVSSANEADAIHLATIDVTLCPGPNVTEDNSDVYLTTFKDGIVDLLFRKDDNHRLFEVYYLTSESYQNSTENNSTDDDDDGEKEGDVTERAKMWMDYLEEHRNSDVCVATYENDLRWTVLPATDAETGYSMIQVELLNITNTTVEVEVRCFTTLSLAIASSPDVCTVEMRREASAQNNVAKWETQSGLEGEMPFFRAGLTGRGQVVAVSDTGIDRNNCYFWDTEHPTPGKDIDLDNRKIVQYVPFVDDSDGSYGHGTHVAGTVAGVRATDGTTESGGIAEVSGYVNSFISCVHILYYQS